MVRWLPGLVPACLTSLFILPRSFLQTFKSFGIFLATVHGGYLAANSDLVSAGKCKITLEWMVITQVTALQTQIKMIQMLKEFVNLYSSLFLTRRLLVSNTSTIIRSIGCSRPQRVHVLAVIYKAICSIQSQSAPRPSNAASCSLARVETSQL